MKKLLRKKNRTSTWASFYNLCHWQSSRVGKTTRSLWWLSYPKTIWKFFQSFSMSKSSARLRWRKLCSRWSAKSVELSLVKVTLHQLKELSILRCNQHCATSILSCMKNGLRLTNQLRQSYQTTRNPRKSLFSLSSLRKLMIKSWEIRMVRELPWVLLLSTLDFFPMYLVLKCIKLTYFTLKGFWGFGVIATL